VLFINAVPVPNRLQLPKLQGAAGHKSQFINLYLYCYVVIFTNY